MPINQTYTRELKQQLDYTATWLPNDQLALGDVGELSRHRTRFIHRTNLENLGIPFERSPEGTRALISHMTEGGVTSHIKLATKAPIPGSFLTAAEAGIAFEFSRRHAIVFLATDCTIQRIDNQHALKQAILMSRRSNQWERNYVVVTELVTVGHASIIISANNHDWYVLKAAAGLGVAPTLEAINVQGSFQVAHEFNGGFKLRAEPGMTPLFRCLGLHFDLVRWRYGAVNRVANRINSIPGDPEGIETSDDAEYRLTVGDVDYDDYGYHEDDEDDEDDDEDNQDSAQG